MKRSKIATLPEPVRQQLEQALIGQSFSGYRDLEAWLAGQGIQISKSAIHRFGATLEGRINAVKLATDQARAIVEASPDDDNAMNDALIRLTQEGLFALLVELKQEDVSPALFAKVAKAIADIGRASIQQKKFVIEYKDRVLKRLDDKAAQADAGGDKSKAEIYRQIREDIYGLS